ncbi:Uncharacterised protein [Corynebacterium renale]|uniref:Uncharacterized protein n=1 Tax=Corynebacterium renale TaxID=1724 RepID=A0A2A9DNN2_9CORY|nr:hypothetical protein ATK06_1456 [Corynebacterium renale]SQG65059.1 Uncharacterised protein [Corynebacterium renale]SQI18942.1 Uncharacterised protein [Corynebacterium renale]
MHTSLVDPPRSRCLVTRIGAVAAAGVLALGALTACSEEPATTQETTSSTSTSTASATTTEATSTSAVRTAATAEELALSDGTGFGFATSDARCVVESPERVFCELDYALPPTEVNAEHPNFRGPQDGTAVWPGEFGFRPVTLAETIPENLPELEVGATVELAGVTVTRPAEAELTVDNGSHSFTFNDRTFESDTWHGSGGFNSDPVDTGASCALASAPSNAVGWSIVAIADGLNCDDARKVIDSYDAVGDSAAADGRVERENWVCKVGPGTKSKSDESEDSRGIQCKIKGGQYFLTIPGKSKPQGA